MKYKIQTAAPFGWADLKTSFDDGKAYVVEEYATREAAAREIHEIVQDTSCDGSDLADLLDYRVVTIDTPQDGDLYD
jgi:hypothetical protein